MLRLKDASEALGITPGTLRNWTNQGLIQCSRSKTGQRIFSIDDIESATRKIHKKRTTVICYSRVSSIKQRDDLKRQTEFLQANIPNEYSESNYLHIEDVGSGINFKRKGLISLLEQVLSRNVSTVIVASKDRLYRFGFELIEWICEFHGTKILVLNQKDSTPESELGEDLMSIVQVYCCRWNGKRRYNKNNSKSNETQIET